MTPDVVIALTWEESDDVLYALRHPRGNKEWLEFLARLIGDARMRVANEAAKEAMARVKSKA